MIYADELVSVISFSDFAKRHPVEGWTLFYYPAQQLDNLLYFDVRYHSSTAAMNSGDPVAIIY